MGVDLHVLIFSSSNTMAISIKCQFYNFSNVGDTYRKAAVKFLQRIYLYAKYENNYM